MKSKVPLGKVVATRGAIDVLTQTDIASALGRHMVGDWGDLEPDDIVDNDIALQHGLRLLSAYKSAAGIRFWIITEADRSATTVLLPSEY